MFLRLTSYSSYLAINLTDDQVVGHKLLEGLVFLDSGIQPRSRLAEGRRFEVPVVHLGF